MKIASFIPDPKCQVPIRKDTNIIEAYTRQVKDIFYNSSQSKVCTLHQKKRHIQQFCEILEIVLYKLSGNTSKHAQHKLNGCQWKCTAYSDEQETVKIRNH